MRPSRAGIPLIVVTCGRCRREFTPVHKERYCSVPCARAAGFNSGYKSGTRKHIKMCREAQCYLKGA
jgi:hypothetical protein